jgi:two-component system LytT family response regulator
VPITRALIVDDERMARKRLRTLLASEKDFEVIGECANGTSAVDAIRADAPDLVFLDVQMPELDGFGVVREIGADRMPFVIFVTAYDQYALRAFEVSALDYLTKPFDRERFEGTLRRVRQQMALREGTRTADTIVGAELHTRLAALLEQLQPRPRFAERLMIKNGGRVTFLRADEVDWIEAAGNYVKLHAGRDTHLLHEGLASVAARLDPARFARIHRSILVNLDRVREVQPWFHGDAVAILRDGTKLSVSRTYREQLEGQA